MQRRKFLKGAAAGGVVAGAALLASCGKEEAPKQAAAPAISEGIKELKMVTTWPKNFPGLGTGAERLAQRITTMSDGKLEVKVYAGGELVPPFQSFDAVSEGKAEMSHGVSYYWQGKSPAFNFFAAVPYGMNAAEHYAWMLWGDGLKLYTELCDNFGVVPFMRASTGVQMGGWYRKEMKSMDDFKGLKFRMPGLGGEVLRKLGATVVNLAGGDIFPALQAGTIDGTEWVGPFNDLAFGFYKVAKFYYWPGFHEPNTTGEVLVNKKVWSGLSKQHQEIIAVAIQAESTIEQAEFNYKSADALDVLINKHGVQLRQYSDEMMRGFYRAAEEVVAEIGNKDPFTKKVYDNFMAARAKAIGWSKLGEQGFMNARSANFKS
ncbi:MAG: TRAP transporter substrate-binding protein [Proteobacteria bacterium]|nr:TRAP transporter substrate-binding protein [Pseudomonadota bacterium]MDA0984130.1 TRAP transporter substrate-binding protein [Pseudomonadota bacterium]